MRKPPPITPDEPLDIFADERFATALAGATRPTAPPPPHPGARAPRRIGRGRRLAHRCPGHHNPESPERADPPPLRSHRFPSPTCPSSSGCRGRCARNFTGSRRSSPPRSAVSHSMTRTLPDRSSSYSSSSKANASSRKHRPFTADSNDPPMETPSAWRNSTMRSAISFAERPGIERPKTHRRAEPREHLGFQYAIRVFRYTLRVFRYANIKKFGFSGTRTLKSSGFQVRGRA